MYIDLITKDNVQNLTAAQEFAKVREQDIKEKQTCSKDLILDW